MPRTGSAGPDDGGFIDLHELSDEALVHWDRDMAAIIGGGEFELHLSDMERSQYLYTWDFVCWIPRYIPYDTGYGELYLHVPSAGWFTPDQLAVGCRIISSFMAIIGRKMPVVAW